MTTVNLKGIPVNLKGEIIKTGKPAPDFRFVKTDLSEETLYGIGDKIKVIIAVPSLDTRVCAIETRKFNEKLSDYSNLVGLVVSMDLPYAMKRFCETEGIKNVISASDFRYKDFISIYNTEITEGKMKGLSARAVFVINKDNFIAYSQLVPEISEEPDYDKALEAISRIV